MTADHGALQTLQQNPIRCDGSDLVNACAEVATYHAPTPEQAERHRRLSASLAAFLHDIAVLTPPGPERSAALSHARMAKMWASAAIALEGK